jgi:L-ascorbate oxidase
MLVNGSAKTDIPTVDPASLSPFTSDSPPSGAAAVTKMFSISQTGVTTWVLDQYPYVEASQPVLYGNSSDGWNANTTIHLPYNATVDLIMMVAHDSMDQVRAATVSLGQSSRMFSLIAL